MSSLPVQLRRQLESAITQARRKAAEGAQNALEALAVHEPEPYKHLSEERRDLRRKLRAQAKQLGDSESQTQRSAHEIKHLIEKLAYDQWHRILFARFLLESNLLISPEHGVSVTLDDCEELAPSLGLRDAWSVAAKFAAKELPEIFRDDDPAGAVELAVEDRKKLITLVTGLPADVFTAADSLGWCYQFWQAERKDEVNSAGSKIGADELPAVTQLFTEDYMVDFLLDNTLGAWRAGKVLAEKPRLAETAHSEGELREAVALPECPWKYLRLIKTDQGKWTPAAGTFDGWPKMAKELTCLDPCMGSGHFVVAMFDRLLALRVEEEKLDEAAATAVVIRDNLFGLEIDPRCTQIAAFNLALAAWRRVGQCKLPVMNLACSGLAPSAKKEDWLRLASDNDRLRNGMERLYWLFKDARILGSLINPRAAEADLLVAAFHELQPLLEKALAQESKDETAHEMAVTAQGVAKAAEILAAQFTLVATNVPYLGRGKQESVLKAYCDQVYPEAKADLATCFVERCFEFTSAGGSAFLVTPQNWLFLGRYTRLRARLLHECELNCLARLGSGAFETISGEVVNASLFGQSRHKPVAENTFLGVDVSAAVGAREKAQRLRNSAVVRVYQRGQLGNPDFRIGFESLEGRALLSDFANTGTGMQTFDSPRFLARFWEFSEFGRVWNLSQSTVSKTSLVGGREAAVRWEDGKGQLYQLVQDMAAAGYTSGIWKAGSQFWGNQGVLASLMGDIPCTVYDGVPFNNNTGAIIPKDARNLLAIWTYCSSSEFAAEVRKIDQKMNVTNATLAKVPFDLARWRSAAAEMYPKGLPKLSSNDPTQWLFNGHPKESDQPLHVAVARLLGYHWPRQTGSSFPDCPSLDPDGLERLAANDGIVCLAATKGDAPAAERLRGLLVKALVKFDLNALIADAGLKGSKSETLEEWLRDEFFEQHCALFHHRPFVWHIWDGHKSGFSALVNYHHLTHGNLEKLAYAHLGDWIRRQQAAVDAEESGSDARLQAAKQLQVKLKLILEGDPPFDLFVRWKPLSKQAIGWHPDIDDGVRMNIRPFATADILRKRVKIKWDKDRGSEPVRNKKDFPWLWCWDEKKQDFAGGRDFDGNRWNDCHYSNDFKRNARIGN